MFKATVSEFPFVQDLPCQEKREVKTLWERFRAFSALTAETGTLIPPYLAAGLLSVSQQRITELMKEGRLVRLEFNGRPFVTEASVVAYANSERKAGRPFKVPTTMKECLAAAKAVVKDSRK